MGRVRFPFREALPTVLGHRTIDRSYNQNNTSLSEVPRNTWNMSISIPFLGQLIGVARAGLTPFLHKIRMSDRTSEPLPLPDRWKEVQADHLYSSAEPRLLSFSATQIQLGILYDSPGKHLKAINKGLVAAQGSMGLVPSEVPEYDLKSKILGKGGDRRFHAKIEDEILYFPGKMTTH